MAFLTLQPFLSSATPAVRLHRLCAMLCACCVGALTSWAQTGIVNDFAEGYYYISSTSVGKYLADTGGGSAAVASDGANDAQQIWKIEKTRVVGDKQYYSVRNESSWRYLEYGPSVSMSSTVSADGHAEYTIYKEDGKDTYRLFGSWMPVDDATLGTKGQGSIKLTASGVGRDWTTSSVDGGSELTFTKLDIEEPVTPALTLATSDRQQLYRIRSARYPLSYLGKASENTSPEGDVLGKLIVDKNDAILCKVVPLDNGKFRLLIVDATTGAEMKTLRGSVPKLWFRPTSNVGTDCQWLLIESTAHQGFYNIKCDDSHILKAVAAEDNQSANKMMDNKTSNTLETAWAFIPANEAATQAAATSTRILEGDAVNGNLGTFSASYPVAIPDGMEVYQASYANGYLQLHALTGGVIPAGQGVLTRTASPATFAMKPALTTGTDDCSGNLLIGTGDAPLTITDPAYVLGADSEGTLGFFKLSTTNNTVGAHKAYLPAAALGGTGSTSNRALYFQFDGQATGIATPIGQASSLPVYDLQGRRVQQLSRGHIYLQGGRKFIAR